MSTKQTQIAYINNEPFEVQEDETILNYLKRHMGDEPVPTLCDAPNLTIWFVQGL